jgi:hypothetical protein
MQQHGTITTEKIGPVLRFALWANNGVQWPETIRVSLVDRSGDQVVTVRVLTDVGAQDEHGPFSLTLITTDLIVDWDEVAR